MWPSPLSPSFLAFCSLCCPPSRPTVAHKRFLTCPVLGWRAEEWTDLYITPSTEGRRSSPPRSRHHAWPMRSTRPPRKILFFKRFRRSRFPLASLLGVGSFPHSRFFAPHSSLSPSLSLYASAQRTNISTVRAAGSRTQTPFLL